MEELISFTYPYPAELVLAMFRDRSYITKKHAQMKQRNIRILEAIDKPHYYRLTIRRDIKSMMPDSVPEFARNLMDRLSSITTTIEWHLDNPQCYVGKNSVFIEGVPLRSHIEYWLVPDADGASCTHKQVIHAEVDMPLIRKQMEKFALDGIRGIQAKDHAYNLEFLKTFTPESELAISA